MPKYVKADPIPGLEAGTIWEYKGHKYIVLAGHGVVVKDPDSGNWHAAVRFAREDNSVPLEFVRQRNDFLTKFKPQNHFIQPDNLQD